ncbi:hypothetical protein QAD02_014084 [Eretmocerus hayati]|uniref:Uncharacterized protein n=1 Tax=Eretmocerus hayati TaxID=131215 RepID=A0ACC2P752_9HYME|nr:hypothetical protein QAD02_014084 [Eretmocerus hayati]
MQIEPSLTKYQTVKPMVPFLMNDLYQLLRNLMTTVIKQKRTDEVECVRDLLEGDLNDAFILRSMKTIDIGFAASDSLNKLPTSVNEKDISVFKIQCQQYILPFCREL